MNENKISIVGIISSPNIKGNSATLVREVLKSAENEGAEIKEIFLPDYKIEFCKGCFNCMAKGKCFIPDDHESLIKILYDADGIVLGSPNYGFSQNAMMKRFLERTGMFNYLTSAFANKYVVGISSAGSNSSAKKVAKSLAELLTLGIFKRGYITGILASGQNSSIGTVNNKIVINKANDLGKKMIIDIKSKKNYSLQNIFKRIITGIFIKPIMTKFIIGNKDKNTGAVYNNLLQRGLI